MKRFKFESEVEDYGECPRCQFKFSLHKGEIVNDPEPDGVEEGVRPGTLIPCFKCMTVLLMAEDKSIGFAAVNQVKELVKDPSLVEHISRVVCNDSDDQRSKDYYCEVGKMLFLFSAWRSSNPTSVIQIAYNFPPNISVVGTIADAISHKLVSANDEAMRAFNELGWSDNKPSSPTVLMVRAVTEMEFQR